MRVFVQKLAALGAATLTIVSCLVEDVSDEQLQAAVEELESQEVDVELTRHGDGLGPRLDALHRGVVPAVKTLTSAGDRGREVVRDRLAALRGYEHDTALVAYAFAAAATGDREALGALADVVEDGFQSDLFMAPQAATDAIFAILGDARRQSDVFHYSVEEQDAAVAAARANVGSASSKIGSGGPESCAVKYVIADASGMPVLRPDGTPISFSCTQFHSFAFPDTPKGRWSATEQMKDVVNGGGIYVPEYDGGKPSKRYNCAGFAFKELSQGQSLDCAVADVLQALTDAGALRAKSGPPVVGDKIFYFPPTPWAEWHPWGSPTPPDHVAVVDHLEVGEPVVRGPNHHSGVFDANIDAAYFTDKGWSWVAYEWTNGAPPRVISAAEAGQDPRYCKDECGGCDPETQVCLDGACVAKTAQTSCALRTPSCCPGQDNSCTAPDAQCYCDDYCQTVGDCCPDVCSVCGFCGG